MANVGEQLKNPEEGYRRISLANYIYLSTITNLGVYSKDYGYNGKVLFDITKANPSSITFSFYSKKFRFISKVDYDSNEKDSVKIEFDNGVILHADQYQDGSTVKGLVLQAEYTFEDYIHTVTISSENNGYMWVDCVDIDEDGCMVYKGEDGKLYYDVTPIMTSNNTPSGYEASASTTYASGNYAPYKAFDGVNNEESTGWASSSGSAQNQYITLKNKDITLISNLMITTIKNRYLEAPKRFDIQGSNDNSQWITLSSYNVSDWSSNKNDGFDIKLFKALGKYQYYRLFIYETNGSTNVASLGELRYLLAVDTPFFLVKDNSTDKIYNYDEDSNSLVEVIDTSIIKENALNNTCIYDLNKALPLLSTLSNNLTLLSNQNNVVNINGIKYDKSMICTLEPISMKKFKTIHSITGDYTIENNGAIKFIFSFDKGDTWKTYDINNSEWNDVSVNIPIKLYENFTDDDKTNWNDSTNTILSDGISVQDLGNVDFQSVKTDKLMFAVAFNRPSYADTCTLKGLNINYDGLETYIQLACGSDLSKYEAKVSITGDSVEVKTASNQDKILVTMTTNI